nr:putative reverse transcriptase domain-containing protein [Tanacetum cinerariifolium]
LVEFAYNNSWHASIKCAPFEMLYGRKYRAPICLDQVGERVIEGPKMIENLRLFWIVKIESRGTRLFLSSISFGGTIPSGKLLGKLRSLSGLLILISFHDL